MLLLSNRIQFHKISLGYHYSSFQFAEIIIKIENNSAMKPQKKVINRNELLQWLNKAIKSTGFSVSKVEHLGSGVGYLLLLNYIHSGILDGVKYNKRPNNQYEYQTNFKILATLMNKLGIDKFIDIDKLIKLKLQDNLSLLQWFYGYASTQAEQKEIGQNHGKKVKVKIPSKLNLVLPIKQSKTEQFDLQVQDLKQVTSAKKKISSIQEIIQNRERSLTDEQKLQKIISILKIPQILNHRQKDIQLIEEKQPINLQKQEESNANHFMANKDQNNNQINLVKSQKKQFSFIKSRKLQQGYQQYINNAIISASMMKKSEEKQPLKTSLVKMSQRKEIFSYEPLLQEDHRGRFTDNSILLHSDRKSIQSETNLLPDD